MSTTFTFTKAVKQQEKLRLALDGTSGSGKTWTALLIATYLAEQAGGRIAVIDSERSSARKYASHFDFDHLTLPDFSPHTYMGAVRAADDQGYAVIIIDSFTHAWEGVLELKDDVTARSRSKNSFTEGWREATPVHNQLVDTVLRVDAHVIATLRTKAEYVVQDDGSIKKVGTKPIQREGVEYEFDVVADMDQQNTLLVTKTRCPELNGATIRKPDERLAETLWKWLNDGEPAIDPADAKRIADAINDAGKAARAAWLERFGGIKPAALGVSRLDEANDFVARLAERGDDPDPDPDPPADGGGPGDGGGEDTNQGAGDDGSASGGDAAPSGDGADGHDVGHTEPEPAPTTSNRNRALNAKDVGRRASEVFRPVYDAAPPRGKTRAADRMRHALVWACTNGEHASLSQLDGAGLARVMARLEDIAAGHLTYEIQDGDDGGVTWIRQSGQRTTVMWAEAEMAHGGEVAA